MQKIEIPQKLLNIQNPPKKLFALGDISLLEKPKIAIVGSRQASFYAKEMTKKIANELLLRDIVVVSGGAMGIDASAHIGAFPNTIAILANSLDKFYPKINEKLLSDISKKGLLLSEHEAGDRITKYSFVLRNRLVVGLCDALIIAEADLNSGSLRSAKFAQDFNVPIYVLPHRLGESLGTFELIKNNRAKVIYDLDEFCDSFAPKKIDNLSCTKDEIIEFCKQNSDLNRCLEKFGDKIYEYEIEGKLKISQMRVIVK